MKINGNVRIDIRVLKGMLKMDSTYGMTTFQARRQHCAVQKCMKITRPAVDLSSTVLQLTVTEGAGCSLVSGFVG